MNTTMKKTTMSVAALLAAGVIAFGVAACGDDEDDSGSDSSETTAPRDWDWAAGAHSNATSRRDSERVMQMEK